MRCLMRFFNQQTEENPEGNWRLPVLIYSRIQNHVVSFKTNHKNRFKTVSLKIYCCIKNWFC